MTLRLVTLTPSCDSMIATMGSLDSSDLDAGFLDASFAAGLDAGFLEAALAAGLDALAFDPAILSCTTYRT